MAQFSETHEVAAIRGGRILEHKEVRKELRRRIAWLKSRIEFLQIDGRPFNSYRRELKAIQQSLDTYNDCYPADEYDTIIPPAIDSEPGEGEAA